MQFLLHLPPLCDIHADDQVANGQAFGVEQRSAIHQQRQGYTIFAMNDGFLAVHQTLPRVETGVLDFSQAWTTSD